MRYPICRYIRAFLLGCWGILTLLMLLYGPWMVRTQTLAIPDISIANFTISEPALSPMPQESAGKLLEGNNAVLTTPEAAPNRTSPNVRYLLLVVFLFPLCTKSLRPRFSERVFVPHLPDIRGMIPLPQSPPFIRLS